jgi:hypothetical protein
MSTQSPAEPNQPHYTPPGAPDPLQLELTDRLDLHGVLDLRQHPGLIRICPGFASSRSREATLDTVPMAA